MKHFKKILATTDFSPESFSALRYAVHLAKAQKASLVLLHVSSVPALLYSEGLPNFDVGSLAKEMEQSARKRLERWARPYEGALSIQIVVREGIAHDTIVEVARQTGASVIVMSTHGRSGIGHFLLGSVTERVLREAPCPVLVVRPALRAKASSGRGSSKKAA